MKLYNSNIEEVQTHKFLCLQFDTKLSWIPHLQQLKRDCIKRLDTMKTIAHHHWGAEESVLLNFYRTFIRSKLEYGSIVYGSASETALKTLNAITNTALRLASGAYRTSPVETYIASVMNLPHG